MFVLISITLILIESSLSIIEVYRYSPYLTETVFAWLNNPLHPSFLSYSLFVGFLFMVNNVKDKSNNKAKIYLVVWVLLYFVSMMMIGARISVLLSFILIVFIVVRIFKMDDFYSFEWKLLIAIFLVGLVFHIILFNFILESIDPVRYHLWKLSASLIWENPWIGIKYGCFVDFYKQYLLSNNLEINQLFGHPHNQFLYVALNFGIPIFIIFIFVLGFSLYKAILAKNGILFFFLLGSLIFMSFDLLLNSMKGVVPFAFFYAYIVSFRSKAK